MISVLKSLVSGCTCSHTWLI